MLAPTNPFGHTKGHLKGIVEKSVNTRIVSSFQQQRWSYQPGKWLLGVCLFLGLFFSGLSIGQPQQVWAQDSAPKKPLLELHGYFRFRGDILQNFALGSAPGVPPIDVAPGSSRAKYFWFPFFYPLSSYTPLSQNDYRQTIRDGLTNSGDYNRTLASANMRFRLQTTLNISEHIRIHSTIDFLDNLVLGSTPRGNFGQLQDPFVPLVGISDTQLPPTHGVNGFSDSIRVKHVYAEVMTPFGLARVGRMPSQWGLGILANSGMGTNQDYGDTVDRVMFITKLFNHFIIPAFDIVSSGSTSALPQNTLWVGQPFDLGMSDNSYQLVLAVARADRGQKLRDRRENGDVIVNYGAYVVYRWQDLTSECTPGQTCKVEGAPNENAINGVGRYPANIPLTKRGLSMLIPDVWFRLMVGEKMRLELEWVFVIGANADLAAVDGTPVGIANGPNQKPFGILQWGGALEFEYRFLDGQLRLELKLGIASGDKDFSSRWGFTADTDQKINNFRFDPDYQIDMILWRELYGTVTNAWYGRFQLTYNFIGNPWEEDGIGLRIGAIYSQALNKEATLGQAEPLGVEANASVRYASSDGYAFIVDYGILFPLPGLSFATVRNGQREEIMPASIAQRINIRINIKF